MINPVGSGASMPQPPQGLTPAQQKIVGQIGGSTTTELKQVQYIRREIETLTQGNQSIVKNDPGAAGEIVSNEKALAKGSSGNIPVPTWATNAKNYAEGVISEAKAFPQPISQDQQDALNGMVANAENIVQVVNDMGKANSSFPTAPAERELGVATAIQGSIQGIQASVDFLNRS